MPSLGDIFPEEYKESFAKANLEVGSVVKIYDSAAKKDKWHLIVGFDSGKYLTASVRINSEVNTRCILADLRPYQLYVAKKDFPFLKHDSYINCAEVLVREVEDFENQMKNNIDAFKGCIQPLRKLDEIRAMIATCPNVKRKHKIKFNLL